MQGLECSGFRLGFQDQGLGFSAVLVVKRSSWQIEWNAKWELKFDRDVQGSTFRAYRVEDEWRVKEWNRTWKLAWVWSLYCMEAKKAI